MKKVLEVGERLDVGIIHRKILTKLGKMSYTKATMIYDSLNELESYDSLMVFATEILANAYGVSGEDIINKIEGE